jgi:hypothetical protein
VAILDGWAQDERSPLQLEALKRLAALKRHAGVRQYAREELSRYEERNALRQLSQLGAVISEESFVRDRTEKVPLKIVFGDGWKGTDDDFTHLRHLQTVQTVALRYVPIHSGGMMSISKMSSLTRVELYGTDIQPDTLDKLKKAMPHVEFDVRRGAMLGIQGRIGGRLTVVDLVVPDSAADRAGLQPGDVIREIDGTAVATFQLLTLEIGKYEAGDEATLTIDRAGKEMTKKVKFGRWP